MLTSLTLRDFKSFANAVVTFDRFSLLVGANASGKSNVREALRFLHGVSRGYSLAEILGEKWADGGVKVWSGIRGGALQATRHGTTSFCLTASLSLSDSQGRSTHPRRSMRHHEYEIEVSVEDGIASIVRERLSVGLDDVFDTHPGQTARGSAGAGTIKARVRKQGPGAPPDALFRADRPILAQFLDSDLSTQTTKRTVRSVLQALGSMTFLDLDPESARRSSPRGLNTLGDRGENLPSVLFEICSDASARQTLTSWIRALTPMDAIEVRFDQDLDNRTTCVLVEADGQETPLSAASDGTVRFLAMIAALLNPARPETIFFEEIENGIHPHRVALLLELIEYSVRGGNSQVIATSHSPQLLVHALGADNSRPVLIVRTEDSGSVAIDVSATPTFSDILNRDDPAELMASGWMEDTAAFSAATSGNVA